jgi:hypothetical protein
MYKIKLSLHIISFNVALSDRCFVSIEENKYAPLSLDIYDQTDETIEDLTQSVFEKYIDLGFEWIKPKLIHTYKDFDTIYVDYACSIPPNTSLKNCYYVSKNISIINRLAKKAMYYV